MIHLQTSSFKLCPAENTLSNPDLITMDRRSLLSSSFFMFINKDFNIFKDKELRDSG